MIDFGESRVTDFGTYYALRHMYTGLFYKPSNYRSMCNLYKYPTLLPSLPLDIREGKYSYYVDQEGFKKDIWLEEWEIVVIEMKEIKTLNYKNELNRKFGNRVSEPENDGLED